MTDRNHAAAASLDDIYRKLKHGVGHELVNDDNVFDLIKLAQLDGNTLIAQELKEWQSPCAGTPSNIPSTVPPTRFSKESSKP